MCGHRGNIRKRVAFGSVRVPLLYSQPQLAQGDRIVLDEGTVRLERRHVPRRARHPNAICRCSSYEASSHPEIASLVYLEYVWI